MEGSNPTGITERNVPIYMTLARAIDEDRDSIKRMLDVQGKAIDVFDKMGDAMLVMAKRIDELEDRIKELEGGNEG